ncbi:hypothetical protein BH20ACT5_BH20ACT5_04070 [soil metagenome]
MTAPEQARLDRVFRGVYAAILSLEALTLLLVPRTVAQSDQGLTGTTLTITLVLVGVLLVLAGSQRRSWALAAGTAAQVAFVATGFIVTAMFFLGAVFAVIWIYTYRLRRELLARLDETS